LETTNPDYSLDRKDEILLDLAALKQQDSLDAVFLSVVDILNEHNTTFVVGGEEEQIISDVFSSKTKDGLADL